jgi:mono/diheme cytochrome c family protein
LRFLLKLLIRVAEAKKTLLKVAAGLVLLVIVVSSVAIGYIVYFKPGIAVDQVKIDPSPERLSRGKYLVENVAQCVACHSERDWSLYSGPVVAGTYGKGGEAFDQIQGFPRAYFAPNLTPHHLKDWSDGEILRAISSGVSRDGRPLFPVMPYLSFGKMDREDVYSMIAYIRGLEPIANDPPASRSDFPMSIIIHVIPQKGEFGAMPAAADKVAYGRYLANAASCAECHTPDNKGQIIEAELYSGGRSFRLPNGTRIVSKNITPHEKGIGAWTETEFIDRFKMYDVRRPNADHDAVDGLCRNDPRGPWGHLCVPSDCQTTARK